MAKSTADLLAMKAELTNDPMGLGLTVLPEDDAANADKINLVRAECQIDRWDIPSDEIRPCLERTEYNAATADDQRWIDVQLGAGLVDARPGTKVRAGFLAIFGAGTETRTAFSSLLARDGARWEEMVQDGLLEGSGDWTPSDIADARQAI